MKKLIAIFLITLAGAFATYSAILKGGGMTVSTVLSDAMSNPDQSTRVEGPDLKSRLAEAIKQGRSRSPQTRFWVAYSFSVRAGVGIDVDLERGQVVTPNAGVYLLYDPAGNAVVRAELYNIERHRNFDLPVYWLGQSTSAESLDLLKGMIQTARSGEVAEKLTDAIGAHDDARAESLLKDLASNATVEEARTTAISSLSAFQNSSGFLAGLARNDGASLKTRQAAIAALGDSPDPAAVSALEHLYTTLTNRALRLAVVQAAEDNSNHEAVINFLTKVAQTDPDPEIRRTAVEALGDRKDARGIKVLEGMVNDAGTDRELRRTALDALGSGDNEVAAPLLMQVAKSNADTEMRVQAVEQLAGASGGLNFLVSLAGDEQENIDVRRQAIESIGDSPDKGALAALQKLYTTVSDRGLKEEIVDAMSQGEKGKPGSVNVISVSGLSGASRKVEKNVVKVKHLGGMRDDHTTTALSDLYDRENDEDTKAGILESLSLTNTKPAVNKLIEVARHDSSSRLRKRAIFLLGQSNDPDAIQFLEEMAR
jgi:HEAT repeat protein